MKFAGTEQQVSKAPEELGISDVHGVDEELGESSNSKGFADMPF